MDKPKSEETCPPVRALGHPVATCCEVLGVANRVKAHVSAQHCCMDLGKRVQHHEKFVHFQT